MDREREGSVRSLDLSLLSLCTFKTVLEMYFCGGGLLLSGRLFEREEGEGDTVCAALTEGDGDRLFFPLNGWYVCYLPLHNVLQLFY